MAVAVAEHQIEGLHEEAELLRDYGHTVDVVGGEELRAEIRSPTYLAAIVDRTGAALVDPGKLCDGLARAVAVRIHMHDPDDRIAGSQDAWSRCPSDRTLAPCSKRKSRQRRGRSAVQPDAVVVVGAVVDLGVLGQVGQDAAVLDARLDLGLEGPVAQGVADGQLEPVEPLALRGADRDRSRRDGP